MYHCLITEARPSAAVTLSRISAELHLVYGREVVYCLKFQNAQNDRCARRKDILGSWHLACLL